MTAKQKQIDYWQASAKDNLVVAELLFKNKHYDSCLFFCHLALEKIIKGLVVEQTNTAAPYIHDLEKLLGLTNVTANSAQAKLLQTITRFNVAGRYTEEKSNLYTIATKKYCSQYLVETKQLFIWLRNKY